MNNKIYVLGQAPEDERYENSLWENFVQWASSLREFQLDIETDITKDWCTRKLITIQFGSCDCYDKVQWVIQWSSLSEEQQQWLKVYLEDSSRKKLIHNAAYEYIVLRFHGIEIDNIYDTMLVEKILNGGIENENYALADISYKYVNVKLDKTEQKNFGDDILTADKVIYAATDVTFLDCIRRMQLPEVGRWNLYAVVALENDVVTAFSEITYHGLVMDVAKWKENESLAQPIVDQALLRLNEWLLKDEKLNTKAHELGYLSKEDRLLYNMNAPQQKRELLSLLFPNIPGATKIILKKYLSENQLSDEDRALLEGVQEKNYMLLNERVMKHHRQYLIEKDWLIPANQVKLNWNSTTQVLPLLKAVHPRLRDLSEQSVAKTTHPVFADLSEYKDSLKLISTYGQKFIDDHLECDGRVRTEFNQIVSTGRVSSKRPNFQNIPAKKSVGTRYRNAFVYEPGWVFVDSDYISQELVLIAYASKDPVWMEAIEKGQDLHSVCAELVYKNKWKDAADNNCDYYTKGKQKCNCSRHKTLRDSVKTVNFGLAYGMSEMKLSATTKTSIHEAAALIEEYFRVFPNIGRTLKYFGTFGVQRGYIQTLPPFLRKRWFPYWKLSRANIETHLRGVDYDHNLGAIERQSKNLPIQGAAADITKTAMVMIYQYIREHGMKDKVHIVAQVHDQITTVCREEIKEEWKSSLDKLMCDAAKFVIPTGILKADTNISTTWTK